MQYKQDIHCALTKERAPTWGDKAIQRFIRKALVMLLVFAAVMASMPTGTAYAHGAVYTANKVGENTLRITLNWSNPSENKGIVIRSYTIRKGNEIVLSYEAVSGEANTDSVDIDLHTVIYPVRVLLYNINAFDEPVFSDVGGHYAQGYIQNLHDLGVVNGNPDGTFKPNSMVSRAEFVTMMVKALGIEVKAAPDVKFTDVRNHWARDLIAAATAKGLLSGRSATTFAPNDQISVAEVSAILSRAFKPTPVRQGIYDKLGAQHWAAKEVRLMFDSGVLTTSDNIYKNFNENNKISRADCAMMISRALVTTPAK